METLKKKKKKTDLETGRIIQEKRTKQDKSLRCRGKENIHAILVNRASMEGFTGFRAVVPNFPNAAAL